jgi:hypothetical protein
LPGVPVLPKIFKADVLNKPWVFFSPQVRGCNAHAAAMLVVAGAGPACAAPAQLYGRSVIVTWNEDREQRFVGEEELRNIVGYGEFSIYLSSTGRPFSRMSFSVKGRSGSRDAVGGESRRSVSLQGHDMRVVMPMAGGARQVSVTFDSGFQSCSARVTSVINGREVEMISVRTGAASCRLQDGNVFAQ